MRRLTILTVALAALVVACATVPYTNRSQLVLVSEAEEGALGAEAFQQILGEATVVQSGRKADLVRAVGARLAAVADRPDFDWEFVLIDDDQVNAFALPGGKTAAYRGILPVAETTTGLAVVMGHEIGHAIARHGAERMSQGLVAELGGAVLGTFIGGGATGNAVMAAYGLGSQVGVLLPFGRKQESEADVIGLMLMARAGYDPREALGFWERMESHKDAQQGGAPPEFLSTHPSGDRRRQTISEHIPQALEYFAGTQSAPVVSVD